MLPFDATTSIFATECLQAGTTTQAAHALHELKTREYPVFKTRKSQEVLIPRETCNLSLW